MTLANARSCGVSVAYLMVTLALISAPMSSVLAQPSNVAIQPGYSMTAVATGLNFPTAMTFFGDTIWVTEEGTASAPPAVKRIDNKGNVTTQLTATQLPAGSLSSPLTGSVFNRGWFWLVHRQTNSKNAPGVPVGVISRFKPSDPVGSFQTVIAGFPSFGDHPNSQIVFGANGRAYINGAAPTNSSVVGPDNGWAPNTPTLHDFPGVDIELSGIGYQTLIPFVLDPAGGTKAAKIAQPLRPLVAARFLPVQSSRRRRPPILSRGSSRAVARCILSIRTPQTWPPRCDWRLGAFAIPTGSALIPSIANFCSSATTAPMCAKRRSMASL